MYTLKYVNKNLIYPSSLLLIGNLQKNFFTSLVAIKIKPWAKI